MPAIVFYDITSDLPGIAWSLNTWKTRLTLNYKGLPYKTEWVEFHEIERRSKELGIKPTGKRPDGSDYYSLPAIHDPATGTYLADSLAIAKYLDATYPETPRIFPDGTDGLQEAFGHAWSSCLTSMYALIGPVILPHLSEASQNYVRNAQEKLFGAKFEDIVPKGERAVQAWQTFKDSLERVDGWFAETDNRGPFIMGDKVSWGDILVGSSLIWIKVVCGEGSKEWQDVSAWHGGRWGKLVASLDKYAARD
ncbi:hypothetical protein CPC08DRAFT_702313 [Agrocybe pediades]|nr:hypothetical protein CPC08DRAFT_702313 [Agrocybe pediades]